MPIQIQPCNLTDATALAHNNIPAFWPDPNWRLMWRKTTLEHVVSQAELRIGWNLLKDDTTNRHQKAVDSETGELVGYARWVLPDIDGVADLWPEAKGPDVTEEERQRAEKMAESADWSPDSSLDYLDEPAIEAREKLMGRKKYLYLQYLAVHPKHQRRGVGTALVNSGVAVADRLGLDCFIQACKAGLVAYYRAGFQLLETVTMDDSAEGGPGEYSYYYLERTARSQTGAG